MSQQSSPAATLVPAIVAFVIYRALSNWGAEPVYTMFFAGIGWFCLALSLMGLTKTFRLWRLVRLLRVPPGLLGRTFMPGVTDGEHSTLRFDNNDGNGIPLGESEGKYLYWHGKGHMSVRAPTEAGKTESLAASILFALGAHRNFITTAKGAELAILTTCYRRDVLGQEVIIIDPWDELKGTGLKRHDYNPAYNLIEYARTGSSELIDEARSLAMTLLPETANGSGDNRIFRSQGREILTFSLIYAAICEAQTGELTANFSYLYRKLNADPDEVMDFFMDMSRCPDYSGVVALAGKRFSGKMKRVAKSAESFLTEAQDALQIYDPSGPLGQSIEFTTFDPSLLKKSGKGITIHVVIPPEKYISHGSFGGICLNSLVMPCIKANSFEPRVTILADEFQLLSNGGALPFVMPTLQIGRSRGVQLITLVQDTSGYKICYGDDASAFTTQSEIVMAWGIRSVTDAEEYSKRIGPKSVMTESGSVPMLADANGSHSLTINEQGVPIYRPDELMQLPKFTAIMYHQQDPIKLINLVSYRSVSPWCDLADPVPGSPPLTDIPVKFKA